MKKLILLSLFLISGCKLFESDPDSVYKFSNSVGKAAGLACSVSNADKENLDEIIDLLVEVSKYTSSETNLVSYWKSEFNDKLLNKFTELDSESLNRLIMISDTMFIGFDYIFSRYSKINKDLEIISCMVTGFVDGFNSVRYSELLSTDYNDEVLNAYDYIMSRRMQ